MDDSSHAGHIRATVTPEYGSEKRLFGDGMHLETPEGLAPITQTFHLNGAGNCTATVLVWDTAGNWHSESIPFVSSAGVAVERLVLSQARLSSSRPNPSPGFVSWDLGLPAKQRLDVSIVGVDGRRLRTWSAREFRPGRTTLVWDGLDNLGRSLPSGRYYLVVSDPSRKAISRMATIVR